MMKTVGIAPSLLTLGNAVCGFVALTTLLGSAVGGLGTISPEACQFAAGMIFLGMGFDMLDGKVARMTGQATSFGAQLDSLCDAVTFGIAPAFLVKCMIDSSPAMAGFQNGDVPLGLVLCILYVVCTILRLARFNVESDEEPTRSRTGFSGMPCPAAAAVIASLTLLRFKGPSTDWVVMVIPYLLPILALLMVSRIPYPHLEGLLLRGRRPFAHLLRFVFFGVLASFLLFESAVALSMLYAATGPLGLVWSQLPVARSAGAAEEDLF